MRLRQLVPLILERRIFVLTQTEDPFEALVRLCNAGYVELATTLLFYIAAGGESNVAFTPYPMTHKLRSCQCFEKEDTMIVTIDVESADGIDTLCIAIDSYKDEKNYFVRPCTVNEIKKFVSSQRLEEGEEVEKLIL